MRQDQSITCRRGAARPTMPNARKQQNSKESSLQAKNGRVLNRFECASTDEILNVFQEIEEEVENQVRG